MVPFFRGKTLGILGGGQLGKLLLVEAHRLGVRTRVLDPSKDCPAASLCTTFVQGDFADERTVLDFGSKTNLLTSEIEHVNTSALKQLEQQGLRVFPSSRLMALVQDKGLQKEFYAEHGFPQADYKTFDGKKALEAAVREKKIQIPFVQKKRFLGYDGKGVKAVRGVGDLEQLLEGACLAEERIDIQKEIAVIVARSETGEVAAYEPVEMLFNSERHLLEELLCPAELAPKVALDARTIALELANKWNVVGLLAVEFFLDGNDKLLVNEVAPRPHNSGHHTIEACFCSQYEQHLRALLGLPLAKPTQRSPAVLFNLLGKSTEEPASWLPTITALSEVDGATIYWYGKHQKPFRKMGHVTIVDADKEHLRRKAARVRLLLGR